MLTTNEYCEIHCPIRCKIIICLTRYLLTASFFFFFFLQPPKIKAFIDKVIQCPLQDIAIPLSGFRWEYGKVVEIILFFIFCFISPWFLLTFLFLLQGNFHHWRPLFLHFDTYFKTYISCRNDLLLSDDILGDVSPFPKQAVLQILRVMQIILENCHNKSSFSVIEVLWCFYFLLSYF